MDVSRDFGMDAGKTFLRDRLPGFVRSIQAAATLQEAETVLMSELDRYGITYAKYGFMPCGDQRFIDHDVLFAGAFHDGWERVYAQENYIRDDYVVERCLLSEKPFSFEEVNRRLESGEFVGKRRQMHSLSRDFNIRNGVAIPLRDSFPLSRGALSLVGTNELSDAQFGHHLSFVGEDLRLIAEAFHTALNRPLLTGADGRLFARERECLLWSMRGLRAQDIADRTGTGTKTVEKQIASARCRLNARTVAQAAVKAMLLGIIEP